MKSTKKLINSSSIAFSMLLVMTILTNFLCFNHVNAKDIKQFKVSTLEDSYKNQFPSDFIEFIDNHLEINNGSFKLKDLNSIRNYIKNNFSEEDKIKGDESHKKLVEYAKLEIACVGDDRINK